MWKSLGSHHPSPSSPVGRPLACRRREHVASLGSVDTGNRMLVLLRSMESRGSAVQCWLTQQLATQVLSVFPLSLPQDVHLVLGVWNLMFGNHSDSSVTFRISADVTLSFKNRKTFPKSRQYIANHLLLAETKSRACSWPITKREMELLGLT